MKPFHSMRSLTIALAAVAFAFTVAGAYAGDLSGVVNFEGETKGLRKKIKMGADPACEAMHSKARGTEQYVIRNGKVKNAFVYLKSVDGKFDPPAEPALLNQKGCEYKPHVQGIIKGQTLNIQNSDETMHNIHCLAKVNKEFNFGQPTPSIRTQVFRRAEGAIKIKCDVHPWMVSYLHVMDHPFFATTASDGTFTIENVPAGTYTLVAWHEKMGEHEQEITVGDDDLGDISFTMSRASK